MPTSRNTLYIITSHSFLEQTYKVFTMQCNTVTLNRHFLLQNDNKAILDL